MASYTLTIYDIPQENKNIELSYNSNDGRSTESTTIENTTWTFTLQNLSYSKAIYKPGELIFKLQLTGCSGVNAIYSTFKGKKVELVCKENNNTNNIAKGYYIFGIQIEKKREFLYVTFQAYDPFKYLTLDTYCKAYTGKKFIQDIFLNKELWPNTLPEAIDEQLTIVDAKRLIDEREAEKTNLKEKQKILDGDSEKGTEGEIKDLENKIEKEKDENTKKELLKTLAEKKTLSNNINTRINDLNDEIKKLKNIIDKNTDSQFNKKPCYLYYGNDKEFIQPYLVQYNESFFDFLVRVSNRCGEFLYYEDGCFNIGLKINKDEKGNITPPPTAITEYVSVNFSDKTATAWKEDYIISSHHNYSLTKNHMEHFPSLLPLNEEKLRTEYGKGCIVKDNKNGEIDITGTDESGAPITIKGKSRSDYEVNVADLQLQDSHLASDENLVSLPPKDKYTKWEDFALWPGCYLINVFTDIVNSANIAEAIINVGFSTGATSASCAFSAQSANDKYNEQNFEKGTYINERKNGDHIHPFSTSESIKNALKGHVTFSLEFYETVRKGIETNERSRIQIALGDHFYPLALGSLIELDGEKYIIVQMSGCANNDAETLDIEAILYEENKPVLPPAAPVSPIREAKAQRAFITHNVDPLKMNRVRVRYPWQGQTEDPTPWIRIALPMASDGSGFNFLPQIGDEAIVNYENGNIEKPYVEGMLYKRAEAEEEEESTVPYAYKRDTARVISSVNGHSIVFSDPPASTDAIMGISPAWKTIRSFFPTILKGDLPDSFKKAMGGIEFTDEHGLYSISMSSNKRAISIDSPLGKVDINAFTGITISAPNGNVRIEGKNIDIVAGNNLSISSGNNIASHFWHMRDFKWGEGGIDFLKTLGTSFLSKFEVIDMGLIRTIIETFVRPCGGTTLIKSNRYLCMEAGKGEAQIAGRQTVKQLNKGDKKDLAFVYDQIDKVSIPYKSDQQVVTNRIPLHINNVIQAIHAADAAFRTTNAFLTKEKNAYIEAYTNIDAIYESRNYITNGNQIEDFAHLYPNNIGSFNGFQMNNASIPANDIGKLTCGIKFSSIQTYLNKLNKHALNIKDKRLTTEKIWNEFRTVYLQDAIVSNLIENARIIRQDFERLFANSVTDTYLTNNGPRDLNVTDIRMLIFHILDILIREQVTVEIKTAAYNNTNKIAQAETLLFPQNIGDQAQWERYCDAIKYEDISLGKKVLKGVILTSKIVSGYSKLSGILDSYIWDSNEDSGKILFSDKAGETLNFKNKEVHYYKKSEGDPLESLKDILKGIQ